ncbi:MAG: TIGR03936 family radical SAM-associated protein [Lachnospiraceae bacterium]|nr:TIGR03936 family radical SAM-associated protein [Lachnospiraceae bacterium]
MKIRIKFQKSGVMKFIGHLDMMRYFQKAMRRADIDIAYSEGFSPHQIMSFAAPLGVGITSDGEYLDIEVHETLSSEEAVAALNRVMVEGVSVVSYRKLPDQAKTAMSIVAAADYDVYYKDEKDCSFTLSELQDKAHQFYHEAKEILVTKQTKKSEKIMDLRQLVYDFQVREREGVPAYFIRVSTGSVDNVKPELFLEAFYQFLGAEYPESKLQIHRLEVYAKNSDDTFVSLEDMGEDIVG